MIRRAVTRACLALSLLAPVLAAHARAQHGPPPPEGLSRQMAGKRITVRFSAPKSADDIIVALIHRARDPGRVRAVSSDTAIRHEAHLRRCACTDSAAFVAELFGKSAPPPAPGEASPDDKPIAGGASDTAALIMPA